MSRRNKPGSLPQERRIYVAGSSNQPVEYCGTPELPSDEWLADITNSAPYLAGKKRAIDAARERTISKTDIGEETPYEAGANRAVREFKLAKRALKDSGIDPVQRMKEDMIASRLTNSGLSIDPDKISK